MTRPDFDFTDGATIFDGMSVFSGTASSGNVIAVGTWGMIFS